MKLMGVWIELWYEVYNRLVFWDIELRNSEDQSIQIFNMQFEDANSSLANL